MTELGTTPPPAGIYMGTSRISRHGLDMPDMAKRSLGFIDAASNSCNESTQLKFTRGGQETPERNR